MNLETRKLSFIQEFIKLQSEDVLLSLEKLLDQKKTELIQQDNKPIAHNKPIALEEFNSDIDQSFIDFENGNFITAKDLKSKIKQLGLTVYWTQFAEEKLKDIFQKAGVKISQN
jgi:hypothetical protein